MTTRRRTALVTANARAYTPPRGRPTPKRGGAGGRGATAAGRRGLSAKAQWTTVAVVLVALIVLLLVVGGGGGGTPIHGA